MSKISQEEYDNYLKARLEFETKMAGAIKEYALETEEWRVIGQISEDNIKRWFVSHITDEVTFMDQEGYGIEFSIPLQFILDSEAWKENKRKQEEETRQRREQNKKDTEQEIDKCITFLAGKEKEALKYLLQNQPFYLSRILNEVK
jgi:hypothetical protein